MLTSITVNESAAVALESCVVAIVANELAVDASAVDPAGLLNWHQIAAALCCRFDADKAIEAGVEIWLINDC